MGKLNTNSNGYIIAYASGLVLIVAFLLAGVYQALKPLSDANVEIDKKSQILKSLNIRDIDDAMVAKFAEVVEADQIIDIKANVLKEGKEQVNDGFRVDKISENEMPLYICKSMVKPSTSFL